VVGEKEVRSALAEGSWKNAIRFAPILAKAPNSSAINPRPEGRGNQNQLIPNIMDFKILKSDFPGLKYHFIQFECVIFEAEIHG
jgi:hypothetical protein